MNRPSRRLVSLRRAVPVAVRGRYDELWSAAQGAVVGLGAHAWRFSDLAGSGHYLEFLEFADGADPRTDRRVGEPLTRLEAEIGAAEVEEWAECP